MPNVENSIIFLSANNIDTSKFKNYNEPLISLFSESCNYNLYFFNNSNYIEKIR